MHKPRSAASMGRELSYRLRTMCYIEIRKDGSVSWGNDVEASPGAIAGESQLFAVWLGDWSSHLFVIDDLYQYARGMGLVHDVERTGRTEHNHVVRWKVDPYKDNPGGRYISINVELDCGCEIPDIRTFAAQMDRQNGWDIAVSGGFRSEGGGATPCEPAART